MLKVSSDISDIVVFFSVWYHEVVSPQNGDIWGRRPPLSDATTKSCYFRPSCNVFDERNAKTRVGFTIIWHSARGPALRWRDFFGLRLYSAERCCENLQSANGSAQCKCGPGITLLESVTSIALFLNNNPPPPRQFLGDKVFLKKKII